MLIPRERNLLVAGYNSSLKYGLKHRLAGGKHAAMGDTLSSMSTEISKNNSKFNLWDKGQLIVLINLTITATGTIFVGDKSGGL